MDPSASLQIPIQDSLDGPRPISSFAQQPQPASSSSKRQQRASHTAVTHNQAHHHTGSSREDALPFTDVYSHPAAVAYATAHPRRTIPKFGPYLLLQTLGEGEFGKVKLGLHCQWGEEVAVKLIRRGNVDNSIRMSKVEREIEVLRTLKHPNIVRLYDVIETDKYIGIILEYASGGELFDHILAHRYLRERDAAKLFSQLISGVWYIHQKKIVHRDLKLENLLLDRHRNVIITDFGFANRFEHRSDDLMQTSCGSPCYAAPELVISEGMYVGSAVDIWSCGVILYAMLAGYLPFDDDPANPDGDNINLLYKYIVNTPLSFPDYISNEARDLLSMMLVPDPKRRSSLEAVMQHPWLAAYTMPKDNQLPPSGTPAAFGRSVEQLERLALDQHQQRRLAYQRQMRATAQQQRSFSLQGGRQVTTDSGASRSQSVQPEFLYDSSVDLSIQGPTTSLPTSQPVPSKRPMPTLGGDDDPFGPPPSSAGKAALLAAEASTSPKGHKASGSAGGGFRHTIQVEYDSEPRGHGRSPSQGQRRSDDKETRNNFTSQNFTSQEHKSDPPHSPQTQPQQSSKQNNSPPTPKEKRPSQSNAPGATISSKPLPSMPQTTVLNGTTSSTPPSSSCTPVQGTTYEPVTPRGHTSSTTPRSHHARTPSSPVAPTSDPGVPKPKQQTPNINLDPASPPDTPIIFSTLAGTAGDEQKSGSHGHSKGRASLDKLGITKIFNNGTPSSAPSSAPPTEASSVRVPSDSGKSTSSVLLSPTSSANAKNGAKKGRRNTLTVIVEPLKSTIRSRGNKSRQTSGAETPSVTNTLNTAVNGKEKAPKSGPQTAVTAKPPARPDASFVGNDINIEGGAGLQASTNKARRVMEWFRGRSRPRDEEPELRAGGAQAFAITPMTEKRMDVPQSVQVVVTTPKSSTSAVPPVPPLPAQRTPSTATADSSTTTSTPSLVTRFRNSVTIGGRDRFRDRTPSSARRQQQAQHHQRTQNQHPWSALRIHHGAMDNLTITTNPPPEVIKHARQVLEGMGMEILVESEYKYRVVRPRKRKGSMVMGAASTPPASATLGSVGVTGGGHLTAVTMLGSAASNGVDKRGLPLPSPSAFSSSSGMLRGLLMRRQTSQVSSSGLSSPLDDDIPSPLAEPSIIAGTTIYGDPTQDAGDEVKFSVEVTRIDRLSDTFCLEIRRAKGNLRSYKFLYDTLRGRLDLQRKIPTA